MPNKRNRKIKKLLKKQYHLEEKQIAKLMFESKRLDIPVLQLAQMQYKDAIDTVQYLKEREWTT